MIERVVPSNRVDAGGLLVSSRQLPSNEAKHVGEQRVERSDGPEVGEAGGPQNGVYHLELLKDGRDREPSFGKDPRQRGMGESRLPQRAEEADYAT